MTPAPRNVQTSGSMPQIKNPKMVTQIRRVYWRGETTTACAICKDFITKNSAIPAKEAKTKKRKIWFLSVIGVQTHGWNKAKIKTKRKGKTHGAQTASKNLAGCLCAVCFSFSFRFHSCFLTVSFPSPRTLGEIQGVPYFGVCCA